ncbi:MAG TPA: CaiB/BaiF CoA-transferase family protein, partial [Solimonas sp.]
CDIVIENYRPGVMDRLGLGYDALSALNPKLIYCAISGFGMTGPLRDRPSFDIVVQALSGAMSVNGEPGAMPAKLGLPMGDLVGGIFGPIGILGALYERSVTGRGRLIDVGLLDGMFGLLGYLAQLAFFTGQDPQPQGTQHPNLVPYGAFPAKDGSIIIACLTNAFWSRVCKAIDMPEAIDDPRFNSIEKRRDKRALVNEMIAGHTRQHTVAELAERLTSFEVPNAPILGIREALAQPQAVAREMVVETEHAVLGRIPIINRSIKFPGSEQPAPSAPPVLGQHTDEILRDVLGLSADAIAQLRASKTVS